MTRRPPRYWLARGANGLRKIASGLRPFGESVWPGVRNDLFVAHESLYLFAARFAPGADVLDAGCGSGYGAAILSKAGAPRVLGVDVDRRSVRYARRHYGSPTVSFRVADCDRLELEPRSFGMVYGSNVLEHLTAPETFLRSAAGALRPGGVAILALPPITTPSDLAVNDGIHYHRTNLELRDWARLIEALPWAVSVYAHRFDGAWSELDFASPFPSRLSPERFTVTPDSIDGLYRSPALTAVFVASPLRDRPGGDLPVR